jgi:beta-galactosidase
VKFAQNAKGRLLCIEVLSNHNNAQPTAVAEIYALDASGKRISRDSWSTRYADSEEENGNHTGDKAFDLQESTYWQIVRGSDFPHLLVIDLGAEQTVSGLEYIRAPSKARPAA